MYFIITIVHPDLADINIKLKSTFFSANNLKNLLRRIENIEITIISLYNEIVKVMELNSKHM